jgi:hypothetical protein
MGKTWRKTRRSNQDGTYMKPIAPKRRKQALSKRIDEELEDNVQSSELYPSPRKA